LKNWQKSFGYDQRAYRRGDRYGIDYYQDQYPIPIFRQYRTYDTWYPVSVYDDYYYPSYAPVAYYRTSRGFDGGDFLRSLISAVLVSSLGFDDVYYEPQYYPPFAYGIPVSVEYRERYYYGGDPYYSYQTATYYDPYYGGGYYDPIAEVFPAAYVLDSGPAGDYQRRIYSQLLATGYEQGFSDGLAARRYIHQDVYYDPYVYDAQYYDPYSSSLGVNRRCLSQGYELGYEDGYRNGRTDAVVYETGGLDLVSVLIGASSQLL
jgi:hypothetical protein